MEQQKQPKPGTLVEAIRAYADPDAALSEAVDSRWPNGITCPHCGAGKPMFLRTRRIWKCSQCRKQFSIKAGTVFEDSPIGLDKWLPTVWMIAGAKNGISSWELHRALGVTQKTAWFMLHRIRLAMQPASAGKLGGPGDQIEADETFIGGKARNMHLSKRRKVITARGPKDKTAAMGIIERGGEVRAFPVATRKKAELQGAIRDHVNAGSAIFTDELLSYVGLEGEYAHEVVNHAVEYVRGNVHTNTMENFWSLLKRALHGTYVSVEPFHLFRYLDEECFRYNNRKNKDDFDRFKIALGRIVGRRLTYKALTGKEGETTEAEA